MSGWVGFDSSTSYDNGSFMSSSTLDEYRVGILILGISEPSPGRLISVATESA
jgi:hypothetical protein